MFSLCLLANLAHADTLRATVSLDDLGQVSIVRSTVIEETTPSEPGPIEVYDQDGVLLATAPFPVLQTHRGLVTPDGHETGRIPSRTARVAIPWPKGAQSIRIGGQSIRHDVKRIAPLPLPEGVTLRRIHGSGPTERRLDLLILADGYTPDRQDTFDADVLTVIDNLLALEPYGSYADMFNIWSSYLPSNEPSPDPGAASPEPGPNDTPLSCAYSCDGIFRLVCCDEEEILATVDEIAPFADGILVLIDSDTFGGSGGLNYAVTFTGPGSQLVGSHELGHSLVLLWDEYNYGFEGGPDGFISPNCSPNDRPVPWGHWMDDEHPEIGRFETCSFSNWVRPTANSCLMNSLQPAYCPVCREHIIKTIYRRLQARMLTEATPEVGTVVRVPEGSSQTFTFEALEPAHGLSREWSMNGELLSTEDTLTVDGCDNLQGELQLVLRDDTEWVRHDPQAYLVDRITWTLKTDDCTRTQCGCESGSPPWLWGWLLAPLLWRRRTTTALTHPIG